MQAASARAQSSIENYRDVMISVIAEIARNYVELRGTQRQLDYSGKKQRHSGADPLSCKNQAGRKNNLGSRWSRRKRSSSAHGGAFHPCRPRFVRAPTVWRSLRATPECAPGRSPGDVPHPQSAYFVPVGLPSDLLLRRPDLRRAENDLRAATSDIGASTADLYPRFFLQDLPTRRARTSGSFSRQRLCLVFWADHSWPVFHGGRIRSNIASTEARRDEALARYGKRCLRLWRKSRPHLWAMPNIRSRGSGSHFQPSRSPGRWNWPRSGSGGHQGLPHCSRCRKAANGC